MATEESDFFGLGPYLRAQRRLAKLSLRQMADLAGVSNPYLSQIERGMHEPSVRILRSIAEALNISAETILEQAGLLSRDDVPNDTETAIRHDPGLTEEQKLALLSVYRSYRATGAKPEQAVQDGRAVPDGRAVHESEEAEGPRDNRANGASRSTTAPSSRYSPAAASGAGETATARRARMTNSSAASKDSKVNRRRGQAGTP